jgi:short-subunit dehydrogenase involved in D-alanine esterification of teichoic acids
MTGRTALVVGGTSGIGLVVAMAATNPNLTGTVIEVDGGARLASLT